MAVRLQSSSSVDFLKALFGDHNNWSDTALWVCGFEEPPTPSAAWSGNKLNGPNSYPKPTENGYYSVAAFSADAQSRRLQYAKEALAVVLDDVNVNALRDMGVTPSYILETSPGNNQVGFVIKDRENIDGFIKLHKALGRDNLLPNDKSGNNAVRYVRLPGCINNKASTLAKNLGQPFITRLIDFHPEHKFTIAELADAFSVKLDQLQDESVSMDDRSDKELWALVESAETFHDPLLKIAARLVARGMDAEEIYNAMVGKIDLLLDKMPSDRKQRLKDERRDLKRSIRGAIQLYGDRSLRNDVDLTPLLDKINATQLNPVRQEEIEYLLPPGRLGQLTTEFMRNSIKPTREVSLGAALTYAAGILGRQFNVNTMGLNLYIVVLAGTGVGKEDGATCVNAFHTEVEKIGMNFGGFRGSSKFRSAIALHKSLEASKSQFILMDEIGVHMKSWINPKSSSVDQEKAGILMELYSKSGAGQILDAAQYSDNAKNTNPIRSPALSLCGFSTHETFYEIIHSHSLDQGLPSRFITIICKSKARLSQEFENGRSFDPELVAHFGELCRISTQMDMNESVMNVRKEKSAADLLRQYESDNLLIINGEERVLSKLATRKHAQALKLAALVAVVENPHDPIITKEYAAWAISFLESGRLYIEKEKEEGNFSVDDQSKEAAIILVCKKLLSGELKPRYESNKALIKKGYIPYDELSNKCSQYNAFRSGAIQGTAAIRATVAHLMEKGQLVEVEGARRYELNLHGKRRAFVPDFR